MSHKTRLLLFTTVLVLGVFAISSACIYQITKSRIQTLAQNHLTQIRKEKSSELVNKLEYNRNTMLFTAELQTVKTFLRSSAGFQKDVLQEKPLTTDKARKDFLESYYEGIGYSDISRALNQVSPFGLRIQYDFLNESNRTQIPPKELIIGTRKNVSYFSAYQAMFPRLQNISDRTSANEILLVDEAGNVIFTLNKRLNLGDNLLTGAFANSRLAQAFRWSTGAAEGASRFFDFAPLSHFAPEHVAFLTAPVFDNNQFIGSVIFQIPIAVIDDVLSNKKNWESLELGKTGEVVAYGLDGFLRNNSRMFVQNNPEFFKLFERYVPSPAVLSSIEKTKTTALSVSLSAQQLSKYLKKDNILDRSNDYLGVPSLKSISRVRIIDNTEWIMVAKISEAEGLPSLAIDAPLLATVSALLILMSLGLSILFYKRVIAPMSSLSDILEKIKNKDFSKNFKGDGSKEFEQVTAIVNQLSHDYEQVSESKYFLENVVQSLSEAFFMVEVLPGTPPNHEDRLMIMMVNPSAERLIGLNNINLKDHELKSWLEFDLKNVDFKSTGTAQNPYPPARSFDAFINPLHGEKVPLTVTWSRVETKSNRVILAFICTDIRWKKNIEEELHLQEQVLKESQALSKTGSFRWDIRTGDCIWSEEQFLLFGFSPNEFAPTYAFFRSMILPEDLALFDQALSEAHRNIKPFQVDLRFRRKDSHEIVWFRCQGRTEYDDYGNALHMYITTQDITELRHVEQSLISTKNEALKASQAKSDFLAQMSHEIRTPMNAIMGMAELLKETKLDEDQKYYVRIFVKAGEVLMSLINDILDLSKIEAGQVSIENIPFDLEWMLSDVQAITQSRIAEKNLSFTFHIANSVNTHLMGDPTKLRQVLINLTTNAIKFTESGSVHIAVNRNPSKKDSLLISVKDTGVGIAENKQHLIFQKFSQADNSITRKYGGTGLGLAISKSLVELMGGGIWFKSKEGEGTTFYFSIPYREQVINPSTQKPIEMATAELDFAPLRLRDSSKKIRILLADDTEDNRTLFIHFLKNGPFEIIEAENGLQALSKIKSDEFDIVFMDVQMPQMDGYAATKAIREWEEESHKSPIPIIALTAHALAEDRQKSIHAGCNAHMAKPFKKDTLLGVINRYSL